MAIKHNSFLDGKVQSLGFTTHEGQDATVGVVPAGDYDFGVAKRRESIQVVHGELHVRTGEVGPDSPPLVFEEGDEIIFTACRTTAYFCQFG